MSDQSTHVTIGAPDDCVVIISEVFGGQAQDSNNIVLSETPKRVTSLAHPWLNYQVSVQVPEVSWNRRASALFGCIGIVCLSTLQSCPPALFTCCPVSASCRSVGLASSSCRMKQCGPLCSMCGNPWTSTSSASCCAAVRRWDALFTADAQVWLCVQQLLAAISLQYGTAAHLDASREACKHSESSHDVGTSTLHCFWRVFKQAHTASLAPAQLQWGWHMALL
jgi:hypothetical protein